MRLCQGMYVSFLPSKQMQLQCWVLQTQIMATMLQCKCGALGGGRSADASGSKSTTARNVNPQICKQVQHFDWSTHVGKNRWCSSLCMTLTLITYWWWANLA